MNLKIVMVLIAIVFIASQTFAADPVFTGEIYIDNNWNASDYNYYDFNVIFYSGVASDADGDLNTDSCEVSFNDGFTWGNTLPTVDFNTDTNRCQANLNYEWGNTGEVYVMFRISDEASNTTTSTDMNWYLDNTPPVTTPNHPSGVNPTVILTAVDSGTPGGDGSGVKSIFYWIDDEAMQTSSSNPTTFTISSLGNHTIRWCSIDNLDNNECVSQVWSKNIYVGNVSSSTCGILDIVTLIIAAMVVFVILIFGFKNGAGNPALIIPFVVLAVSAVIGIVVFSSFFVSFCSI